MELIEKALRAKEEREKLLLNKLLSSLRDETFYEKLSQIKVESFSLEEENDDFYIVNNLSTSHETSSLTNYDVHVSNFTARENDYKVVEDFFTILSDIKNFNKENKFYSKNNLNINKFKTWNQELKLFAANRVLNFYNQYGYLYIINKIRSNLNFIENKTDSSIVDSVTLLDNIKLYKSDSDLLYKPLILFDNEDNKEITAREFGTMFFNTLNKNSNENIEDIFINSYAEPVSSVLKILDVLHNLFLKLSNFEKDSFTRLLDLSFVKISLDYRSNLDLTYGFDSLIDAIVFQIASIVSDKSPMLRACTCGNIFRHSASKHKYCSLKCQNSERQRRFKESN